ncbi:MAG: phosphatidate cytidylyltransferase [Acidobacteria bacterium]|nr:phosphatidate cytidylyltransferase [Acidobacteriota bacterium]
MITLMGLGLLAGPIAVYAFFILVSCQALREFNALTPLTALLLVAQYGVVLAGLPPAVVLPALLVPRQRWALLLAVAGPAHIPALPPLLMVFLVLIAQASDVFQFLCGKAFGRHRLAPTISPNKTVEGLLGGGGAGGRGGEHGADRRRKHVDGGDGFDGLHVGSADDLGAG